MKGPTLTTNGTQRPSGPKPERVRITRLSAEQRREQLLNTAADIVVASGIDSLTMELVGQEAGASKTLGYAYFTNVEQLIAELWKRELMELFARIEAATEVADDLDSKMAEALHAYFSVVHERGLLLAVLQERATANRGNGPTEPHTIDFLRFMADIILLDYDLPRPLAMRYAIVAASVPGVFARTLSARQDREAVEVSCRTFVLAGLRAALGPYARVSLTPSLL